MAAEVMQIQGYENHAAPLLTSQNDTPNLLLYEHLLLKAKDCKTLNSNTRNQHSAFVIDYFANKKIHMTRSLSSPSPPVPSSGDQKEKKEDLSAFTSIKAGVNGSPACTCLVRGRC